MTPAVAVVTVVAAAAAADVELWCVEEGEMLTARLRSEYERLFASCVVNDDRKDDVERVVTRMMKARDRYARVSEATGVPWHVIALIHNMECDPKRMFECHLHNGDPLRARTVQVPAGRPVSGNPPFTWEESAVDALIYDGFDVWTDWSIGGTLFKLERYNGIGYQSKGINTPYLWSGSQHYVAGKYVRDGVYDPKAVSEQLGAAVLLRRLIDQNLLTDAPRWAPSTARRGRVEASTLNVRDKPNGKVIANLPAGAEVTVVDHDPMLNWVLIETDDGTRGWCSEKYLATVGANDAR